MKKILVLTSMLFLAGCQDLDGTLQVFKNFKAVTKNGTQTIKTGTYETSLDFKHQKVVVSLKTSDGKTQFTIKTPEGTEIPNNGNFEVKSAESGQPFDVLGNNKTVEKRSEIYRAWESCQYQGYENVCMPPPGGCQTIPVTRWGQQYQEYYFRLVTHDLKINLVNGGAASDTLAQFLGHSSAKEKVITQQTSCF